MFGATISFYKLKNLPKSLPASITYKVYLLHLSLKKTNSSSI